MVCARHALASSALPVRQHHRLQLGAAAHGGAVPHARAAPRLALLLRTLLLLLLLLLLLELPLLLLLLLLLLRKLLLLLLLLLMLVPHRLLLLAGGARVLDQVRRGEQGRQCDVTAQQAGVLCARLRLWLLLRLLSRLAMLLRQQLLLLGKTAARHGGAGGGGAGGPCGGGWQCRPAPGRQPAGQRWDRQVSRASKHSGS